MAEAQLPGPWFCVCHFRDDFDCMAMESTDVLAKSQAFLSCNPCKSDSADASGWGGKTDDLFTRPVGEQRNVIGKGQKRFFQDGETAPEQPPWEKLSPRVLAILACNPSAFTLNGTNCYLVGTGKHRILIDTGEAEVGHQDFLENLEQCMKENDVEGLQEIFITHEHHDHYGGIEGLLDRFGRETPVAKMASSSSLSVTMETIKERGLLPYLEHEDGTPRYRAVAGKMDVSEMNTESILVWPDEEAEAGKVLSWDIGRRTKLELVRDFWFIKQSIDFVDRLNNEYNFHCISHDEVIQTEGATLIAYHTPGHALDHCSFMLQEENGLFSGDTVLGWGTTYVHDLYDYMNTLQFMLSLKPQRLYPGHGPMINDGTRLVERYIAHRTSREKQVEDALLSLPSPMTDDDIVADLYPNTAKHRLWMARENVLKILRKLERARSAMSFLQQEDGSLKPFVWPPSTTHLRRMPKGLVWLHSSKLEGHVTLKEFGDEVVFQSKL